MDIHQSDAVTGYSILTYILTFFTGVLTFFDTHAAGIVAMATLFTAFINWRHQKKRTEHILKNDN